ncbi:MAG: L,D-transpeptidase [Pseudomonadota bacterium]
MRKQLSGVVLALAVVAMPGMSAAMPAISPESVARAGSTTVAKSALKTTAATIKPQAPRTTLQATIDLSRQRMTVVANGKRIFHWPISSGRRGYETPRGSFRPGWMARKWHSRKYNMAPMPYSVFFNRGIATHGTTAVSRLGRPASHGCIRLRTSNARTFYNLVRRHGMKRTRIVVTGRARKKSRKVARRSNRVVHRTYRPRRRAIRYTVNAYHRTPAYRPRRGRHVTRPGNPY